MGLVDDLSIKRAQKLLESGLEAVSAGQLAVAREKFKASAATHATADALTYWGWMEHHLGNTELAIDLCRQAIERDPDFGNPYNDIGSYLVSQGKNDEAIPWLERAIQAPRYEPRQYPHINLAKIYLAKGFHLRALSEYKMALKFIPNDPAILEAIREITLQIN